MVFQMEMLQAEVLQMEVLQVKVLQVKVLQLEEKKSSNRLRRQIQVDKSDASGNFNLHILPSCARI
jgi:hypothetical protein